MFVHGEASLNKKDDAKASSFYMLMIKDTF